MSKQNKPFWTTSTESKPFTLKDAKDLFNAMQSIKDPDEYLFFCAQAYRKKLGDTHNGKPIRYINPLKF